MEDEPDHTGADTPNPCVAHGGGCKKNTFVAKNVL